MNIVLWSALLLIAVMVELGALAVLALLCLAKYKLIRIHRSESRADSRSSGIRIDIMIPEEHDRTMPSPEIQPHPATASDQEEASRVQVVVNA
ncbi:hypothetical protein Mapa_007241 [Marchantia paleacea]|nr:hypothetical protein Mapa_007241 [Marchantia paleacea]